jgi:hypothetical protein
VASARPRLAARLGLALAWALRFDESSAVARDAARGIAETESRDAAADYLAAFATALNEAGGLHCFGLVAREGLDYAGERRDLTWAVLKASEIVERELDGTGLGLPTDSAERREVAVILEASQVTAGISYGFLPWTSRSEILTRDRAPSRYYVVGNYRQGIPLLREDAVESERVGKIGRAVAAWAAVSRFHVALGEFCEGRDARRRAGALAERLPGPSYGVAQLIGAEDEWRLAQDEGWDDPMHEVGPGVGQLEMWWYWAGVHGGIARLHAHMGRVEPAMRRLKAVLPAIECSSAWAENYPRLACDAADTLWLTERRDHIETIERNLRAKVIDPDFRYPMMDGRLAMARLCALQHRYDEARDWFARARAVLDEQGARPLRAIVDHDEALMYARRGEPGDAGRARPLLEAALAQFRSLGMPGWIRRAEALRERCETSGEGS